MKEIDECEDTHGYGCVSDIEGGPGEELPKMDIDEIDYVTKTDTVYYIAHLTTQNKSAGQRTQGASWGETKNEKQDNQRPSYPQSDQRPGLVRKQTKNGTSVLDVNQVKQAW
jgi:hypothetical protein